MQLKGLRKIREHKILFSVLIVIVAIAVIVVSVYAKYLKNSNKVENTFAPAVSDIPEIQEQFEDRKVKKDVKIKVPDKGYPVYVRATIVVNWQEKGNENGAFYFDSPKDTDYSLSIGDKWMYNPSDKYYYYLEPVPSNGVTDVLIKECKPEVTPPEGYALSVNIVTQTVQAVGHTDDDKFTAVFDAWGVDLGQ